jgi:osmoprotectant transport system permease protein
VSSDTSTLTEPREPGAEPVDPEPRRVARRADVPIAALIVQPVAVLVAVVAVAIYVATADLNSTESVQLNLANLGSLTLAHVKLTLVTALIVVVVAVSLGIIVTRPWARAARPVSVAVANLGQAAPAVGLLVLATTLIGIGFKTAVIALALYGALPTLLNTMTGLEQVDRNLVEAARGMGMSAGRTLTRIELPLAVPVILTGIRLSLVLIVGTAALASFIGAPSLGQLIITGVNLQLGNVLVVGAVLIAALALLIDWLGRVVELLARPKGLA